MAAAFGGLLSKGLAMMSDALVFVSHFKKDNGITSQH